MTMSSTATAATATATPAATPPPPPLPPTAPAAAAAAAAQHHSLQEARTLNVKEAQLKRELHIGKQQAPSWQDARLLHVGAFQTVTSVGVLSIKLSSETH